ncbi:hypothetical protein [Frankia sp. Cj5]|uniref:hypothetical protein n=1 Tax=Frankia sp. Cj5 TaxID=2880978 RepID=UPI001EF6949E|nr:hypothetical protein [Frankia sp. Cj5]
MTAIVPATASQPSAEVIDRDAAVRYLSALHANITNTVSSELESLLGGMANAGLTDPDVVNPVHAVRELLTTARDGVQFAVDALNGGHAAVSETVNAVDAADSTDFYRQH